MELHSKDRYKKVAITDVAISKVQRVSYKGLTEKQNEILYRLTRMVLMVAKEENNSNEAAMTIDLDDPESVIGIQKGDEHEIVIGADTDSYHLIRTGMKTAIVHNHPSTQTLSMQDIHLFLGNDPVHVIVVVSNQGVVHYLMKDCSFDFAAACDLYNLCVSDLTKGSTAREKYNAALEFLAHCTEVGLFYH